MLMHMGAAQKSSGTLATQFVANVFGHRGERKGSGKVQAQRCAISEMLGPKATSR
jgi:hypothetical protein